MFGALNRLMVCALLLVTAGPAWAQSGTLSVASEPAGLTAYRDGRELGITPFKTQLKAGTHTLIFRQDTQFIGFTAVAVRSRKTTQLKVVGPGKLTVGLHRKGFISLRDQAPKAKAAGPSLVAGLAVRETAPKVKKQRSKKRKKTAKKKKKKKWYSPDTERVGDPAFAAHAMPARGKVLVVFEAPWCGYCRRLSPHLSRFADTYADQLTVVRVDFDAAKVTRKKYGVRSVPGLLLFEDGELTRQRSGMGKPYRERLQDFADVD